MKIKEAAFIGYPVTDVQRARTFYQETLGLSVGDIDHEISPGVFWIEYDLGNVTLGISNAWPPSGESGPTLALEVDDFDTTLAELKEAHVTIDEELVDTPVCRFALIRDPDGNSLMVHQRKHCNH